MKRRIFELIGDNPAGAILVTITIMVGASVLLSASGGPGETAPSPATTSDEDGDWCYPKEITSQQGATIGLFADRELVDEQSVRWDIDGDGEAEQTGSSAYFSYEEPGEYTVEATLSDSNRVCEMRVSVFSLEDLDNQTDANLTNSPS